MIRVNNITIPQNRFPDNSLFIKLDSEIKMDTPIIISWNYEGDEELFSLICIKRTLDKYNYTDKIILNLPYIPHARMDRVESELDVFTLKYFCEIINSLNFYRVEVLDAHSNVSLALLNRVIEKKPFIYIDTAIQDIKMLNGEFTSDPFYHPEGESINREHLTLFYPDEGAMKRYSKKMEMPYSFGIKNRDWASGKILNIDLVHPELVKDHTILIVDDICSKGGTFYYSAKALKGAGAKSIYLYVTHCENTILKGEIFSSGLIDRVYTTKSLIHSPELKKKIYYVDDEEL